MSTRNNKRAIDAKTIATTVTALQFFVANATISNIHETSTIPADTQKRAIHVEQLFLIDSVTLPQEGTTTGIVSMMISKNIAPIAARSAAMEQPFFFFRLTLPCWTAIGYGG